MSLIPLIPQPAPPPPTARITLGELFQHVALATHKELSAARGAMRGMDPELRTTYLRKFTSRTMKRLTQLYAICQWLAVPQTQQLFSSLTELYRQCGLLSGALNETQDRLFWAHSFVFAMRSRPLEVAAALDVLACGTYPALPHVIFSCGRIPTAGTRIDKHALASEADVFIRCKLGLGMTGWAGAGAEGGGGGGARDALPVGAVGRVCNGTLTLEQPGIYTATVSLLHLDEEAPWVVLDAHVLAKSAAGERFDGEWRVD